MSRLYNCVYLKRFLHGIILTCFLLTYAIPAPVSAINFQNIGVNELAFMYRVHKILDKYLSKKADQKTSYMIDAVMDLKLEIETSFNTYLDIDQ